MTLLSTWKVTRQKRLWVLTTCLSFTSAPSLGLVSKLAFSFITLSSMYLRTCSGLVLKAVACLESLAVGSGPPLVSRGLNTADSTMELAKLTKLRSIFLPCLVPTSLSSGWSWTIFSAGHWVKSPPIMRVQSGYFLFPSAITLDKYSNRLSAAAGARPGGRNRTRQNLCLKCQKFFLLQPPPHVRNGWIRESAAS